MCSMVRRSGNTSTVVRRNCKLLAPGSIMYRSKYGVCIEARLERSRPVFLMTVNYIPNSYLMVTNNGRAMVQAIMLPLLAAVPTLCNNKSITTEIAELILTLSFSVPSAAKVGRKGWGLGVHSNCFR